MSLNKVFFKNSIDYSIINTINDNDKDNIYIELFEKLEEISKINISKLTLEELNELQEEIQTMKTKIYKILADIKKIELNL